MGEHIAGLFRGSKTALGLELLRSYLIRCGWARALAFTAGLLAGFPIAGQICDPAPPGVIGWWPGDVDVSDIFSTNNGMLEGGATAGDPGFVEGCMVFDGTNGYAAIPDSPVMHPTNLTIEAWVRCDNLNATGNGGYPGQQYMIFHQNSMEYNFEGFDLAKDRRPPYVGTNDTWCFEVTSTTGSSSGSNVFVESTIFVQTNVWYHLAGVRGSNYIQLYVNGQLQAQTSVDFPQSYGTTPLYFADTGEHYYDPKFAGALDEVTYYNRALGSNEIAAIYAAGHQGKCKEPTVVSIGLSNGVSEVNPQLTIAGIPGQNYAIQEVSGPLGITNDWVSLTNLTLLSTADLWLDPAPVLEAQRYYRATTNSP